MNIIKEDNFHEFYPKIKEALRNATFIAIDAEFSGLRSTNDAPFSCSESLFDSPKERYGKLRRNIEPFIAMQFGLTTFTRAKHENTYSAESFDFHLLPRALPTRNRTFLIQAASVQFLSNYNFDFNQFAYNAISYLDEGDEAELRKSLQDGASLWDAVDFVSIEEREEANRCFHRVEKWLKDTDEAVLKIQASCYPVCYLMQKELRASFRRVWTESLGKAEFGVIRVEAEVRRLLEEKNSADSLDDEFVDSYMGFSNVFKLMTSLKKPIVGHNLLLDLMFMHKQFFRPLPDKYEIFKSNINRLFPLVYDTKFLSFEMKKVLNRVSWKSNVLADLYAYFKDGQGRYLALNSPCVTSPFASSDKHEEKFHNAAWDSYCTGYCFIRMAHIYAVKKLSEDADLRCLTNTEIMNAVGERVNRINLIRADLSHLRLDGPDPPSTRPRWLYVRSCSSDDFTTRRIARDLSRFGIVDVKRFSANGVLVAVPNHGAARDILRCYEGNADFQIVPYNPLRHSSRTIKAVLWVGSLFLTGAGICAWILRRGGGGGAGGGISRD